MCNSPLAPRARQDGATPLIRAAESGHVDCLRLLAARGADVNDARGFVRPSPDTFLCLKRAAQNLLGQPTIPRPAPSTPPFAVLDRRARKRRSTSPLGGTTTTASARSSIWALT